MNVKGIVAEWLQSHSYSGLLSLAKECGCELDDLFTCIEGCWCCGACEPGHRGPDPSGESDFLIYQTLEDRELAIKQTTTAQRGE